MPVRVPWRLPLDDLPAGMRTSGMTKTNGMKW
jgi:hypothetical protein